MRLVLVRHGETGWNRIARLQGRADAPLSERGRAQVLALRPSLAGFEQVLRSPLARAAETAALLGYADAVVDERWTELDLGEWTSRSLAELPAGEVAGWRAGTFLPPGGEPFEVAQRRVGAAIDDLMTHGAPAALVITHGGAIRSAVAHVTGFGRGALAPVPPGATTVLDLRARAIVSYGVPASPDGVLSPNGNDAL